MLVAIRSYQIKMGKTPTSDTYLKRNFKNSKLTRIR
jgi:hypothetical protein